MGPSIWSLRTPLEWKLSGKNEEAGFPVLAFLVQGPPSAREDVCVVLDCGSSFFSCSLRPSAGKTRFHFPPRTHSPSTIATQRPFFPLLPKCCLGPIGTVVKAKRHPPLQAYPAHARTQVGAGVGVRPALIHPRALCLCAAASTQLRVDSLPPVFRRPSLHKTKQKLAFGELAPLLRNQGLSTALLCDPPPVYFANYKPGI